MLLFWCLYRKLRAGFKPRSSVSIIENEQNIVARKSKWYLTGHCNSTASACRLWHQHFSPRFRHRHRHLKFFSKLFWKNINPEHLFVFCFFTWLIFWFLRFLIYSILCLETSNFHLLDPFQANVPFLYSLKTEGIKSERWHEMG